MLSTFINLLAHDGPSQPRPSEHDNAHATSLFVVDLVPSINSPRDWFGPVFVKVEMQLSVSFTKLLGFEE